MRLDKFLCDNTELSRSMTTKVIRSGRVFVNQTKAKSGSLKIQADKDVIVLDGEPIEPQAAFRYFMMNKPKGVVCANDDAEHPLVFDLLESAHQLKGIHTVGRLDKDTTGLLLMTNDGQWSHFITSPKHHQAKTYRAWLAEPLCDGAEAQIEQGLMLKDEAKPTLPGQLERITDSEVLLTIHEGRYHQVKRMMAALGNRVMELHREVIGSIQLDPSLKPGQYRELTQDEVKQLSK